MATVSQARQARPFGVRDKLGYLFGDFGNDFTFLLSTVMLMKFYTDVMGISAGVVGTVMMIARFVDGFTDVTMGRICDRSRMTAQGRFKPWILRMCGPVAIASFLIYQSGLAELPYVVKTAYLFVTYILWGSVFYTAINIPYGSMASAISPEPNDRQSLSTWRSMGAALAGLIIGVLLPLIAYDKLPALDSAGQPALDPSTGEPLYYTVLNGPKVTLAAGICSVLAVVCYLLCYALTTERVRVEAAGAHPAHSVREMLRNALCNRALMAIIAASVVMLLAQLTMQNMAAYIYPDYYNTAEAQSVSTLLMTGSMLLAAAFARPLAARFGKAEISAASNLFAALVCVATYVLRPASVWVFVGLQTLNWLGLGMFTMVSWALVTDVIDHAELQSGVREDGSIYALYSFARKLGQAVSAGASGWLLTLIGYSSETAASGGKQTAEVLQGVFGIATLVPAVGFALLAAVLWFWYPLHRRQVEANVAELKARHGRR